MDVGTISAQIGIIIVGILMYVALNGIYKAIKYRNNDYLWGLK